MQGTCDDCESVTRIALTPYGTRFMAEIACPKCGVSYATNLDDADMRKVSA